LRSSSQLPSPRAKITSGLGVTGMTALNGDSIFLLLCFAVKKTFHHEAHEGKEPAFGPFHPTGSAFRSNQGAAAVINESPYSSCASWWCFT
jgi:hypothetical protein